MTLETTSVWISRFFLHRHPFFGRGVAYTATFPFVAFGAVNAIKLGVLFVMKCYDRTVFHCSLVNLLVRFNNNTALCGRQ